LKIESFNNWQLWINKLYLIYEDRW
jgi:hypothetical protein